MFVRGTSTFELQGVRDWLSFFFSSRRRHTRCSRDWSSDVCSSDLAYEERRHPVLKSAKAINTWDTLIKATDDSIAELVMNMHQDPKHATHYQQNITDRKSTRLNSSHGYISYAVFCLKKKNRSTKIVLSGAHPLAGQGLLQYPWNATPSFNTAIRHPLHRPGLQPTSGHALHQ